MVQLKVLELFSGIGCQTQALTNLGIDHISTQCEIDKYAVDVYNQIHGETPNLGDITKVNPDDLHEGQWDLITYSSPCQDFSICGLNRGGDKGSGTRSSLLFECEKIIRKVKPKYLLFENVKNLLSDQHIHNFMEWLNILRDMGYRNYYDVLNAKDYGIPQNRERVFCVSILGEDSCFEFPQKEELKLRLKDMLEDSPNEKYYLSKKVQDRFVFKKMGENVVGTTAPDGELGEFYRCYSKEGVIGTLKGVEYKQPKQIFEPIDTNKIIEMNDKAKHQQDLVQHEDGVCRCIPAGTHGSTPHLLKTMVKEEPKIDRIGGMYGQATRWGVYNKEGICPTIVASMGEGGGHVPMIEETKEPQINQVGELDTKGFECCRRVYGTNGLSPAVTAMGGDHVHKIIEQPQINKVEIAQKVRIRKNEIDIESLKALLKKSKQEINKTTKEIAEELDRPITEVEHWFRTDDSFSVPSEDIWFDLKDTLNIQTDEFDKAITEFIEKDNTYDIRNRAYKDNGISPTLTTANIPNVVEEEPKFNNTRLNETIEKNKDKIRDGSFIDSYNKTINNEIAGTITTRVSSSNCTHIAEEERLSKQAYETLEENNCKDGDIINPFNKKVTTDGICPTITTRPEGFKTANLVVVDESSKDKQGLLFDMEEQQQDTDEEKDTSRVINPLQGKTEQSGFFEHQVHDTKGIARTLMAGGGSGNIPKVVVDSSCYPKVAKNFEREKNAIANSNKDIYYPKCESGFQDNHVGLKVSATIRATNDNNFALDNHFRIRKLTPRECWRLMGWKDEQFDKIKGISNAQLYKQAGNGIVVNVLEAIFRQMFLVKYDKSKMSITGEQLDLF